MLNWRDNAWLRGLGWVCFAAAVGGSARVHAQIVQLSDLEGRALRARPSLSANDARIAQARARIDAARSAYAPTISLNADVALQPGGHLVQIPARPNGSSNVNCDVELCYLVSGSASLGQSGAFTPLARYGAMLDVHGNLYDFGRTSAAVDAALAQQRAAQADAHRATHDIVRDVRAAYVHWATAYALSSLAEQAAQAVGNRARQTSASIEEGARPSADRLAAESDAAFANLELERARATLESARQDLGFVSVTDLAESARPADDVLTSGTLPPETIKAADPALSSLREQRTAAQATARVHDHAFAPVISAQAQAGVQGASGSVFPLYRVGLNVSVPLWDGGADSAHRSEAEAHAAELAAAAAQYNEQREQFQRRTETTRVQAARRIDIAQDLVRINRARLAQLEEGYPLGAATLVQLADARAALQRAQTELVLAQAMRAEALLGVD